MPTTVLITEVIERIGRSGTARLVCDPSVLYHVPCIRSGAGRPVRVSVQASLTDGTFGTASLWPTSVLVQRMACGANSRKTIDEGWPPLPVEAEPVGRESAG